MRRNRTAEATARRTGGPFRRRLVVRLIALSLVPLLAVALLMAGAVRSSQEFSRDARAARREAEDLRASIIVHMASINERIASESFAAGVALGLTTDQMSQLLGYDILATMREARTAADEYRDFASPAMAYLPALDVLRARIDSEDKSVQPALDEVRALFDRMHEARHDDYRRRLAELSSADTTVLADGATRQHLWTLERLVASHTSGAWQLEYIGALMVPGPMPADEARRNLIAWTATYEAATEHLDATLTGTAAEVWRAGAEARSEYSPFATAVHAANRNDPETPFRPQLDEFGSILQSGIARNQSIFQAVEAATGDLLDAIDRAVAADEAAMHRELVVMLSVVAVTMCLSYLTARSVGRPLRRLARRAHAMRDGHIDGDALVPHGPYEVRVVTAAFNEAVANLRNIDSMTAALARGDLDAAESTSVPGEIGRTLRGAMERLAASIREGEELQRRLRHQAHHDSLTGLTNRWGIEALLDDRAADEAPPVAVLFVDLHGFRGINSVLGHRTGDLVLQAVAARIVTAGAGARVARYGGDQWVVVMNDDDLATTIAAARRIIASLDEPVVIDGRRLALSCVVGVAFSAAGEVARTTIRNADLALAEARRSGPGSVRVYDVSLREALVCRREVEHELREALRESAIEVHYQPVVDAASGVLRGVEALARWRCVDGRLRPPAEFVPVAEESDLIVDLDRFVLRRAAEDCAEWRGRPGFEELHVAVNVSARHIAAPQFVEHVFDVLDLTRLDPTALVLEITESVLLTDLPQVSERLTRLRSRGVRVAIDDFGTGFTSVGQLRSLPVDVLKIDRSFIGDTAGPNDRAIVPLVAQVGRALRLEVVAEGVETEEHRGFVREAGCDLVQGYLTGRPVPLEELVVTFGLDAGADRAAQA